MAFDAQQKKINDVLSGDVKYVIPRYQRKYVWQEKQWRELFDDIKYCLDVTNEYEEKGQKNEWTHFLGSLVFERNEKDLIVIDGQQRLTTITLILCSICTLFNELKEESRFRGVTKYIIGTDDMGQDYVRVDNQDLKNFQLIVAASTEYNSLQSKENLFSGVYLTNSPQDNVNIKQCFIFFYTQLKEIITKSENPAIELGNIKDKIMGLDVIDIRASNQQESYNIFEILNARGVDLKQHELIKNYIFKYIHPRANIDTAKITWDSIETNMYINRRSTLDSFFTHYVSHRFAKPSKDNTEFRIVKQFCDRQHMGDFLNDLLNKSSFYRMFYCPDECDNLIIRESLRFFLENNHRQFRPLFLSVISAFKNEKITEKDAEDFFIFIRNFYFGYGVVCNGKSNTIEEMVYSYARKIENEDATTALKELRQKLHQHYPDFSMFESHFIQLGWSNKLKSYKTPSRKKEVQYILSSIEEYHLSRNKELKVRNFSIEHIANDDGTTSHCLIGNLLMLAEPINNGAADKTYKEKLSYYSRSNFISTQNFLQHYSGISDWTDENIAKRGKYMAKLAYDKIWNF